MRLLFIFSLFVTFTTLSFSQTFTALSFSQNSQSELPTVISPSPTISSLMRFEEVPVDHYTGQPTISVPLESVKMLDGMVYPIGVNYNTQAIRVDERSGWIGTGFTIPAGGAISRTIRGIPDELNSQVSGIGIFHNDYEYFTTFDEAEKKEFLWKTANGAPKFDSDHDLYQYNVLGKAGRFIIKKQGNQLVPIIIESETNDQITVFHDSNFMVTMFEIRDTSGNIYTFEESNFNIITSYTTSTSQYGNSSNTSTDLTGSLNVPNTWYLKNIKTSNDIVLCDLIYQDVEENYQTPTSYMRNRLVNQNINFGGLQVRDINKGMLLPREVASSQSIISTQKYVKEVIFHNGTKVEYVLDTNGHPEYNNKIIPNNSNTKSGAKLKSIIVSAPDSSEFKKFNFFYETTVKNRLFLTKIEELYDSTILPYHFNYKNKEELEGFGSDKKDNYGYFNNGANPNIYISSKRAVDTSKITTGVLKSINYPTGGNKEFVFESNNFSYQGNVLIDPKTIPENRVGYSREAILTGSSTIINSPEKVLLYLNQGQIINITNVINNSDTGGEAILDNHKVLLSKVQPISGSVNPPLSPNGGVLNYTQYNIDDFEYVDNPFAYQFDVDQGTSELSISSGWYIIEMKTLEPYLTPNGDSTISVTSTIRYSTFQLNTKVKNGGGIRIKEIVFSDNGQQKKNFFFNYLNDHFYTPGQGTFQVVQDIVSSGSVEVDNKSIRYIKNKTHPFLTGYFCMGQIQTNHRTTKTGTYEVTRDVNQVLTPMNKGNYVGYKKVYVKEEGNGGELFTFISPRDVQILTQANTTYPFKPVENNNYKRGVIKKREIFNESRDVLIKEEYDYLDVSTQVHTSIFPFEAQNWDCPWDQFYNSYGHFAGGNAWIDNPLAICADAVVEFSVGTCVGANMDMIWTTYNHIRGLLLPKEVIKTEYFYENSAVSETTTTTNTLYNSKNRVKQKTTEFLEGASVVNYKEDIFYPYDYDVSNFSTIENTVLDNMVVLNIIESPVQVKKRKNGILINDSQYVFKEFHPNLIKMSETRTTKSNIQETRLEYHRYDSYGNPLEVSKKDGTHIVYIWGYDQEYPVAKIENARYSEIENLPSFGVDFQIPTNLSAIQEQELRSLTNSMVSTYTYQPLVGITSMTDPRGYTMTYHYDAFNRLEHVKDQDGNILSKNEYNYANQNQN